MDARCARLHCCSGTHHTAVSFSTRTCTSLYHTSAPLPTTHFAATYHHLPPNPPPPTVCYYHTKHHTPAYTSRAYLHAQYGLFAVLYRLPPATRTLASLLAVWCSVVDNVLPLHRTLLLRAASTTLDAVKLCQQLAGGTATAVQPCWPPAILPRHTTPPHLALPHGMPVYHPTGCCLCGTAYHPGLYYPHRTPTPLPPPLDWFLTLPAHCPYLYLYLPLAAFILPGSSSPVYRVPYYWAGCGSRCANILCRTRV